MVKLVVKQVVMVVVVLLGGCSGSGSNGVRGSNNGCGPEKN